MQGRWLWSGRICLSPQFGLKYTVEVHQGIRRFKKPAFLDVSVKCQRVPPSPPIKKGLSFRPFFIGGQDVWTNQPGSTKIAERFLDAAAWRGGPERSEGRAAVPGREQSHPLRHSIFEAFLRLESLRSFPAAKLLPNSADFRGRIPINLARFVAVFTAEIAARESRNAARASGLSSIDFLIA